MRRQDKSGCYLQPKFCFASPLTNRTSVKPWKDEHQAEWAEIEGTLEAQRRSALEDHDPAFAIPLKGYVVDALTRAHSVGLGPYWDKADQGTKHSLEKFLS